MKLNGLLILVFFLILGSIYAQTDFRPGFIIRQNGDTLIGDIDYRGDIMMGQVCTFKSTDNKRVQYSPADISGFRFIDSKYYVSKRVGNENVFLEFLINGQVKVFYLRDNNGDHYYVDKEGIGLSELPYEEMIKHSDDRINPNYLYKSNYHIGVLNIYMKDAPEIQSRISSIGKPDRKNLIKLALNYHNIVCKNDVCVIYEKKLPSLKLEIEIVGGIVNYPKSINSFNKHNFEAGILTHLWMPLANEKLFFKSGILFSSINQDTEKIPVYRIPIQIEFVFPKGIVRPKFAYGIVIYSPYIQTTSLSAGFNIKLYKSINLGINYDIEFIPNFFFIPNDIFSHTILAGLVFKL